MSRAAPVYHLADPAEWAAAVAAGGPYVPGGYRVDGFVHCSFAHQLAGTLARWFGGHTDLVLLTLDAARLGDALVVEPGSAGEAEGFPHCYAPVPLDAVLAAVRLEPGTDGSLQLPPGLSDV